MHSGEGEDTCGPRWPRTLNRDARCATDNAIVDLDLAYDRVPLLALADSGGPLVVGSTPGAIVSWRLRCGGDKDPTVFTDPWAYRSFLASQSLIWRRSAQATGGPDGRGAGGRDTDVPSPACAAAGQDRVRL
jgi:hypothetical protein